jgi:hypothetical protein
VASQKSPRDGVAATGSIDHFTLFVDGVQLARCRPGERLPLDTAQLADGHHELRVVATESSSVQSLTSWTTQAAQCKQPRES